MNLYDLYTDALEKVAKNVPTSPEKWARAKAQARAKFDVYPSAYANGWAAKKYKAMGGGWKKEAAFVSAKDLALPAAIGAAGGLYIKNKRKKAAAKKAELTKEAFLGKMVYGAGKLAVKGARRFMFGKKGIGTAKAAKHAYKRSGQLGTAAAIGGAGVSAAKSLTKKVTPQTPPKPTPPPAPPSTV